MASSGKQKTTMAKLMRESRLRERRLDKQARKDARKQAPADHQDDAETPTLPADEPAGPRTEQIDLKTVTPALSDMGADVEQSSRSA
jgi:hypothetical protein